MPPAQDGVLASFINSGRSEKDFDEILP